MAEQIHDKGYKRILSKKKNFIDLLQKFIRESWVDTITEEDLELIDKEFIPKDFQEKEADIIYKLKINGKEVIFYFLLELQSTVDYTMCFRLLIYMVELYKRLFLDTKEKVRERSDFRLPPIIPCVLYNGGDSWTAVKSFQEYLNGYELFEEHVIDFKYILLNVNQYSDESLLEIGNLVSSIFTLDKKQSLNQFKNNLEKVAKIFIRLSEAEQIDFIDWMKDVLMKKVKEDEKRKLVVATIESFQKGDVMEMTYAIERLFDEIEENGIEKGIEKVAVRMLIKGKSMEEIQDSTDLSIERIMELKDSLDSKVMTLNV